LNVVITGGSKGLGKALAREFLQHGDRVIITGRSQEDLGKTLQDLRSELSPELRDMVSITGTTCDICKPEEVEQLAKFAKQHFGNIDVWVCNAGYSGGFKSFLETKPETIAKVRSCSNADGDAELSC
jgi:chlorophyll(ide) b reductase